MSFYQFLAILNARKIPAILVLLVVIGLGAGLGLNQGKTYKATTTLVVNYKGVDPVTGKMVPSQMMPGYMATQVDIISSRNVALKVVDQLNLYSNPQYVDAFLKTNEGKGEIRNWIADKLLADITVIPSSKSSVISLVYSSADANFAATMANAFAKAYIDTNLELKIEPSKRTAEWFSSQVEVMRQDLMRKQEALSSYQRAKNIVSIDERLDVENNRLAQLSTQLVSAQAELFSLQSQLSAVTAGNTNNAELLNDPLVSDLKVSLSRAEVQLDELRGRVSANHPDYVAARSEIRSLKIKLNKEIASAKSRIESSVAIATQKVNELDLAIKSQREALLLISENRNQLDILKRDVDVSEQILNLATQRLNETRLEGESSEGDVSILNPAIIPTKHSAKSMVVILFLFAFVGTILGLMFALFLEFINRRVRVADDLTQLGLPILAELGRSK